MLCGPLFVLMLAHSWSDAWVGDFWIYVATVGELAAHPIHPHNPLFGNDYAFAFLSPYTWLLGVACRLSRLRPFEILVFQGLVNLVLLLAGLYAFVATWLRRPSAAFYALLFVLFLWGADPWRFSSFFHLGSLGLVLPYPSTFAAALALASLAAFPPLAGSGRWIWAPLAVPVMALLWIIHPVNGLFLCLGLLAFSLERRRSPWHWAALALAVAASLGLALAWPLYPVRELWLGQIDFVHEGNDAMYDRPLSRVGPALLGAPWLLFRLRRNARDPLALLCLLLAALVTYGGLSGQWSYGRLLSHAALLLQVALGDAAVALEERLARLRRGAVLQHALAPALAALLLGSSWSAVVSPVLAEAWRGDPRWLSFLESRVEHHDVVLTDLDTCWYVPSFRGKVVAYPMQLPFVPDHAARVQAVVRFFERGVPREERDAILRRYDVSYLLIASGHLAAWQARLDELRPLGRVVYSSPDYELLRVDSGREERGGVDVRGKATRLEQVEPDRARVRIQHVQLGQDLPSELDAARTGRGDDPPVTNRELVPIQRAPRVVGGHTRQPGPVIARVRAAFQQACSSQRDGRAADRRDRHSRGHQLPQLSVEARGGVLALFPALSPRQQEQARVARMNLVEDDVRRDPQAPHRGGMASAVADRDHRHAPGPAELREREGGFPVGKPVEHQDVYGTLHDVPPFRRAASGVRPAPKPA